MTVVMNATNFISKDGDADLSEVDDMLDTLTDATDQLKDGSGELADGVDTLKSKMGEFKDGVGTLKNGIKDYTDGARVTDCKTQLYFCDIVKLALVSQLFSVFDEFYNQPCCRYVTVTSRFLRSLRCRHCLFLPIFLADHLRQGVKKWS